MTISEFDFKRLLGSKNKLAIRALALAVASQDIGGAATLTTGEPAQSQSRQLPISLQ